MLNEPFRCWFCGNWKSQADDQCGVCGYAGRTKNGNAAIGREQTGSTK